MRSYFGTSSNTGAIKSTIILVRLGSRDMLRHPPRLRLLVWAMEVFPLDALPRVCRHCVVSLGSGNRPNCGTPIYDAPHLAVLFSSRCYLFDLPSPTTPSICSMTFGKMRIDSGGNMSIVTLTGSKSLVLRLLSGSALKLMAHGFMN